MELKLSFVNTPVYSHGGFLNDLYSLFEIAGWVDLALLLP